jgi:chemotaxis protein histidine kinase CheA
MADIETTADPLRFDDAVGWFRQRVPVTDSEYAALGAAAKSRAFKVAGAAHLDLVTDVWDALDRALDQGTDLRDFQEQVGDRLQNAWGGSVENPGWRLQTIFRTNVQSAYQAGHYKQAQEFLDDRPAWLFIGVHDDRQSEVCQEIEEHLGGKALPADDPFWKEAYPPNHHCCRSGVATLTAEQAEQIGYAHSAPTTRPDKGFRGVPGEDDWSPDPEDYPDELQPLVKERLATAKTFEQEAREKAQQAAHEQEAAREAAIRRAQAEAAAQAEAEAQASAKAIEEAQAKAAAEYQAAKADQLAAEAEAQAKAKAAAEAQKQAKAKAAAKAAADAKAKAAAAARKAKAEADAKADADAQARANVPVKVPAASKAPTGFEESDSLKAHAAELRGKAEQASKARAATLRGEAAFLESKADRLRSIEAGRQLQQTFEQFGSFNGAEFHAAAANIQDADDEKGLSEARSHVQRALQDLGIGLGKGRHSRNSKVDIGELRGSVAAIAHWDGTVTVNRKKLHDRYGLLETLVHEECHMASPLAEEAYCGIGTMLEEGATELVSRNLSHVVLRKPVIDFHDNTWDIQGAYPHRQRAILQSFITASGLDPRQGMRTVVQSILKAYRSPEPMRSAAQYARLIAKEAGLDSAQADAFWNELRKQYSEVMMDPNA